LPFIVLPPRIYVQANAPRPLWRAASPITTAIRASSEAMVGRGSQVRVKGGRGASQVTVAAVSLAGVTRGV